LATSSFTEQSSSLNSDEKKQLSSDSNFSSFNNKTSQKIGGAISLRDVITSSKLLRVLVAAGYKT
jgi:hypothetical protein